MQKLNGGHDYTLYLIASDKEKNSVNIMWLFNGGKSFKFGRK